MPMQSTPSPWCLVMALQLAEHTEGTRGNRVFSVVQSAGKGYTVGQDRSVRKIMGSTRNERPSRTHLMDDIITILANAVSEGIVYGSPE